MKDRYKFRIYKKVQKRMLYDVTYLNPLLLDEEIAPEEAKNHVLMQCSGLKDKNGRLIYEGDIVGFIDPYENDKIMTMPVSWESTSIVTGFNFGEIFANGVAVIGNIYENPELFKEAPNEI